MAIRTAEEMHQQWLQHTIADCVRLGWRINLWCSTCGYNGGSGASLDVAALRTMDQTMTLKALGDRASFERCDHRGAWVSAMADVAAYHIGEAVRLGLKQPE